MCAVLGRNVRLTQVPPDQSRSGREQSFVSKLVYYGFTFEQIDSILRKARIGKWAKAPDAYRKRTHERALCF